METQAQAETTNTVIPQDGITVLGWLPDDPDHMPIEPPNGLIWMRGSSWSGSCEWYGIVDVRVQIGGKKVDFTMTIEDARALQGLLGRAIASSEDRMKIELAYELA